MPDTVLAAPHHAVTDIEPVELEVIAEEVSAFREVLTGAFTRVRDVAVFLILPPFLAFHVCKASLFVLEHPALVIHKAQVFHAIVHLPVVVFADVVVLVDLPVLVSERCAFGEVVVEYNALMGRYEPPLASRRLEVRIQ